MQEHYDIVRHLAGGNKLDSEPAVIEALDRYGLEYLDQDGQIILAASMELLDPELLNELIRPEAKSVLSSLDLRWSLDSTNTQLLGLSREANFHGYACMAEQQTAGKGRRGRHWVSPFGKNIYLSLGWILPANQSLEGLSLAVGCACVAAIEAASRDVDVTLKWPNDLLINSGKAGGILVELGHGASSQHHLVIGVGINLQLSERDSNNIDQPWSVVSEVSRNQLAASLLSELAVCLDRFSRAGFSQFQELWNSLDGFAGKEVNLLSAAGDVTGIARGVDSSGNLLLEVDGVLRKVNAGEVSLRASTP